MCGDAKARVQGGKVMTFSDCRSTHRWSSIGGTLHVPYPPILRPVLQKFLIFSIKKIIKNPQNSSKLYPFFQLSDLFTCIVLKFVVWLFLWISLSWEIWIIFGRFEFVIRLLFLHIMLTFVLVWISNQIKIIVLENIVSNRKILKAIGFLWIFNW